MPLDYMLRIMRDPDLDPARRDVMARSAAPMCLLRRSIGFKQPRRLRHSAIRSCR
jgi:hypothetical protein